MRLLYYELKKLAGMRYLWAAFFVMLAACCILFVHDGTNTTVSRGEVKWRDYYPDKIDALDAYEDFLRLKKDDPERAEAIVANVRDYWEAESNYPEKDEGMSDEEYEKEVASYFAGIDEKFDTYQFGSKYSDGRPLSDEIIVAYIDKINASAEDYERRITGITNVASGVMKRLEAHGKADSPVYEYERRFYELYAPLSNVEFTDEPVRGWNVLFLFDKLDIFLFLFLALAAMSVFVNERTSGTLPILRATTGGRIKLSAAKLGALMTLTVLAAAAFILAVTVECGLLYGFSSGKAPIQMFGPNDVTSPAHYVSCVNCPYPWTVAEYFAVSSLYRILAAVVFTSAIALVSALFFSPAVSLAAGMGVILANVAANNFVSSSGWFRLNLFCVSSAYEIVGTHDEVYFAGRFFPVDILAVVIYGAVFAVCASSSVLIGGRRGFAVPDPVRRAAPIRSVIGAVRDKWSSLTVRAKEKSRRYPSSLFAWECRKLLTPGVTALVILLLLCSVYLDFDAYDVRLPDSIIEYESYVNENLLGAYTEEKAAALSLAYEENKRLTSSETYDDMTDKYYYGEITAEEYGSYLTERDAAVRVRDALERASAQSAYLEALASSTGINGWYLSEYRLTPILSRGFDVCLLAAVIVIFSRVCPPDYAAVAQSGDFASIARTTRRGRRASYSAKVLSVLAVSLAVAAVFTLADFAVSLSRVPHITKILSAPVVSISRYGSLDTDMTVAECLAAAAALRFLSCAAIACITAAASFAFKKTAPTLFFAAAVTLLPYVLVNLGVDIAKYIDMTAMLSGFGLLFRSAELSVFGSVSSFALLLSSGVAAASAAALLAWRKTVGK